MKEKYHTNHPTNKTVDLENQVTTCLVCRPRGHCYLRVREAKVRQQELVEQC